jgi:hypothetical protein
MNKFDRSAKREYTVITPFSPLENLEAFLENNLFALGASLYCVSYPLWTIDVSVPVTDSERKFVLAVATQQDLDVRPSVCTFDYRFRSLTTPFVQNFVTRRGRNF